MQSTARLGFAIVAASLAAAPAIAAPLRVMTLGDSLTYGYQFDNGGAADEGGYRPTFYNKLVSSGPSKPSWQAAGLNGVDMVGSQSHGPIGFDADHEGHGGWKIGDVTSNVSSIFQTTQDVDVVVLMVGINDVRTGTGMFYKNGSGYTNYTLADSEYAVNRLLSLVNAIKSQLRPNAYLLVSTLLPVDRHYRSNLDGYPESFPTDYPANGTQAVYDQIVRFNNDLRSAFVASDGVKLVDPFGTFVTGSGLQRQYFRNAANQEDGIHLSDAGHQALGNHFGNSVLNLDMSIIPEPTTVLLAAAGFGGLLMRRQRAC